MGEEWATLYSRRSHWLALWCGPQAILSEMDVSEGFFFEDELLDADEVFLTNSIVGALPVEWMLLNHERVSLGHGGGEWHNEMTRAIQTGVELDSVQS